MWIEPYGEIAELEYYKLSLKRSIIENLTLQREILTRDLAHADVMLREARADLRAYESELHDRLAANCEIRPKE